MSKTITSSDHASTEDIQGYSYGQSSVARSPVSLEELRQLEQTAGWTQDDARILERYERIFRDQAGQMVDSWRSVIGSHPHLAQWFYGPDGQPDEEYKSRVRKRFVQWVADVATRPHDRCWLDYQEEIGLRHTPARKNQTDHSQTAPVVPLRYVLAFGSIVSLSGRKFFAANGVEGDDLEKLQEAWTRAVQLHLTLWARPYTREGLW